MKYLVLGVGLSGKSVIKYLLKKDRDVSFYVDEEYVNDDVREMINLGAKRIKDIDDRYDYVIRSPGMNSMHPIVMKSKSMRMISEIEFTYLETKGKGFYIGVTGSLGKSTVVTMLHDVLNNAGKNVILAGNIGKPLIDSIDHINDNTIILLEMSSFMLEDVHELHFNIASILNMFPNHLDSVPDSNFYYLSKFNIINNQNENDYLLLPIYDDVVLSYLDKIMIKSRIIFVTNERLINLNCEKNNDMYNINVVFTICKLLQIKEKYIIKSLNNYKSLPYRQEYIGKIKETKFINDSKSTTIESTLCCCNNYAGKKLLIVGGKDKKLDYNKLNDVTDTIAYGEIKNNVEGIKKCKDLDEVFNILKRIYREYDYVLFSPATSSYDQYSSYIERGKHFNSLFKALKESLNDEDK